MVLPLAAAMASPVVGSAVGGLIGAAGSLFSGKQSADFAQESYKKRYQWQVKDLQKAGLNPMLAVSQGPGNVPQPSFPDIGEGASRGASAIANLRLLQQQQNVALATEQETLQKARGHKLANDIVEAQPEYQDAQKALMNPGTAGETSAKRVQLEFAEKEARINNIAQQTVGHELSNKQLEKIQPVLLEIEKLRQKGLSADLIEKQVNAQWFDAVGASDKYGQWLKMLLQIISRATR